MESLFESTPPGMESWVKKNKSRFKKQYGEKWASYLYGTAWRIHNNESSEGEELEENIGNMGTSPGKLTTPESQRQFNRARKTQELEDELSEKELLKGGKADKKTLEDIAKKHGVTLDSVKKQMDIGHKVESEHSRDKAKQHEIVMDHLWENPKYYKPYLLKMEAKAKKDLELDEEQVNPDDKIGNMMLKKMGVPSYFKSNKKKQTVSQKKVSENLDLPYGTRAIMVPK